MERICYTRPDGGVSVVVPSEQFLRELMTYGTTQAIFWAAVDELVAALVPAEEAIRVTRRRYPPMSRAQAVADIRDRDVPGGVQYEARVRTNMLLAGKTEAEITQFLASDTATNVSFVDHAALPSSRRFRNAWRRSGAGAPVVDIPAARQQLVNEVRGERDLRLKQSDIDLLRALESRDTLKQTALSAYRQALRDFPITVANSLAGLSTDSQLEAWQPMWPAAPAP